MSFIRQIRPFHVVFLLVLLAAGYFRASGLYRGLGEKVVAHPDSPKQMMMLNHYLHGEAVAYQGNLFYDGYPYGLNQVDAWAIRAAQSAGNAIRGLLIPGAEAHPIPSPDSLFYWGRSLRVLYGLMTLLLVFGAVGRFGRDRWIALAAAALYGLAPLGSTVTHSATGDIGVDLFIAAALYCAAAFATDGRSRWLAALSVACGMAFACKYQGFLGLWIGVLPLLLGLAGAGHPLRQLVRRGLAMVLGFATGVLALTPAFFVDPAKTGRNMWLNFSFLKNYGVSRSFLEQPLFTRMRWGLGHNVPAVAEDIGYGLMALGLLALSVAARAALRVFRADFADGDAQRRERRRASVFVAVASFPWVALFLATALKPEVQPFHFSFLLPALAVSSGFWLLSIRSAGRGLRIAAAAVLALAFAELAAESLQEDFFWSRPEIHLYSAKYSQTVFGTPGYASRSRIGSHVIKQFYAEPAGRPVFRSRPSGLKHPAVEWWQQHIQLPVPSIPFPGNELWIFMNGPVFPRNDRMFAVPASGNLMPERPGYDGAALLLATLGCSRAWTERSLVFNQKPAGIQLGLRTGRWPSRYVLEASGEKRIEGFLPPHSQVFLALPHLQARISSAGDGLKKLETHIVTLRMRAQLGPVWATVLASPEERARYAHYGPPADAPATPGFQPDWNDEILLEQLRSLRYVDGTAPLEVKEKPAPLPGGENPLEAGAYVLTAKIMNAGAARRLRFELVDLSGLALSTAPHDVEILPGEQELVWRFTKDFIPYDATLCVSADARGATVASWNLAPDVDALKNWRPSTIASPAAPGPGTLPETILDIRYPGLGTWHSLRIADEVAADQSFPYAVRFDLDEAIPHRAFHEDHLFLHLWNAQGKRIATLDYPLSQASFTPDLINWQMNGPFPAGHYTLEGGLYNIRTGIRAQFDAPKDILSNPKRRYFYIKELIVAEPSGTAEGKN